MAFTADARVRVNDLTSQHRGRLGVVISVDGDDHQVRLDGFPTRKTFLLTTSQLQSSTQAIPITYS